jgi:antirestriction protein ArdC
MAEFGSENYSIEELVAELGTCYLTNTAGILHKEIANSAAYIDGWLKQLKNDKRFIIRAAGNAQKAVDYILNAKETETMNEIEQSELLTEN